MPRGGARAGAGRPKKPPAEAARPFNPLMFAQVAALSKQYADQRREDEAARRKVTSPFHPAQHPPAATPTNKKLVMAMDESLGWAAQSWSAQSYIGAIFEEGLAFPGYPYLSQLAQRAEYRVISETTATEMTRKWIRFRSTSTKEDKSEQIKQLQDAFDKLEVQDKFKQLAIHDGFFGRAHLFLDTGADLDDNRGELATAIGTGTDEVSASKVGPGRTALRRLQVVEPVWAYPTTYNAQNPLREDWYNPQVWYVMGKEVHATRMPRFVGHPVPDMLKPAYSFGGLSMSQMAQPYVDIWLNTRQAVADLVKAFSVMVLATDMQAFMQDMGGGPSNLIMRAEAFNALRGNQGLMMLNKGSEEFQNVTTPLSGLSELQAQSQEHMAAVARTPIVKLLGIQPAGLNADSDGIMRAYDETIGAAQNSFFRPKLRTVMWFTMLSLWGKVDPDITFEFEPLQEMTAKENAEIRKLEAETDDLLVNGVAAISPEEVRKRVLADPDTPYQGADVDDLPEPPSEAEEGDGGEGVGGKVQLGGHQAFRGGNGNANGEGRQQ